MGDPTTPLAGWGRNQRDRYREAGGAAQGGDATAGLNRGADLTHAISKRGDGRVQIGGDKGEAPEEGGPIATGALDRLLRLLHDLEDDRAKTEERLARSPGRSWLLADTK